jgi:hypothetical protein
VNVPGIFLGAGSAGRVYTLDTSWDEATLSVTSTVHALDLTDRGTARLAGTVSLPGWATGVVLGSGYAWAVTQEWTSGRTDVRLAALDLAALRVASSQRIDASWAWPLLAGQGKLFLAAGTGSGASILVIDLSAPGAPRFEKAVPSQGWAWDVVVEGRVAYLPLGPWVVAMIPLAP